MIIDNRIPIPSDDKEVLAKMFATYNRVFVKHEFSEGFSGSRVYLVRPIRKDGRTELPSVVKVDDRNRIEKEWQAYQDCIRNRLPSVARISDKSVFLSDAPLELGGLRYPLAGDGAFDVVSLQDYYQEASIDDIEYVLKRLFKSLETLWNQKKFHPDLHLHAAYDSFLHPNLLVEYTASTGMSPQKLYPENVQNQAQTLQIGDEIQLSGFQVERILQNKQALVLDIPVQQPGVYRFQIQSVPDITKFTVGQKIPGTLTGQVIQTRMDALHAQVLPLVGGGVDLTAVSLTLPNNDTLPNPLHALPQLFQQSFDVHTACIHADLHLGNVLVEPQSGNIHLIDFVNAREDHVLRDFLHLELAIINRLLPTALDKADFSPKRIIPFYERLHCALRYPGQISPPAELEKPFAMLRMIRETAVHYLFKQGEWREYYSGLVFYLLGSLRYGDLDKIPGAKQTAFWGAATILKLLETDMPCDQYLDKKDVATHSPPADPYQGESNKGDSTTHIDNRSGGVYLGDGNVQIGGDVVGGDQTKTVFHGPVSGPIHTGSGDINMTNVPKPDSESIPSYRDSFSPYEIGIQHLLTQMGTRHPRYTEALGYQDRLRDNISRARRFGDTNLRKADRAEIVEQLNKLSLSATGRSFNKLCRED